MDITTAVKGLEAAQRKNEQRIAKLRPGGPMGALIKDVAAYARGQAVAVTHVDTGTLRASHRVSLFTRDGNPVGRVYIDPAAVNPKGGKRAAVYGPYEHARRGGHAFYTIARGHAESYARSLAGGLAVEVAR